MDKTVMRILGAIGIIFLFYLTVVLIASIVQLADAADRIYLGSGQIVFWLLASTFILIVSTPFYLYFKLPKALVPPTENYGIEFDAYLILLRKRLSSNLKLKGVPLKTIADINAALEILSQDANKITRETASAVFISTSISQNGRLDGLVTLATQARMVWKIACIYQQRPSPRQMIYLYSNVGANALLAESIEDIDLTEIIAPILGSSLTSVVPGTSFIVNSIIGGAGNAFLTLRVGAITKQYCEALSTPSESLVRRNATIFAVAMLGEILKENSSKILGGSWSALKTAAGSTVQGAKELSTAFVDTSVSGVKAMGGIVGSGVNDVRNVAIKVADSSVSGVRSIGSALEATVKGVASKISPTNNSKS